MEGYARHLYYNEGVSLDGVGRRLGCSRKAVTSLFERRGWARRPKARSSANAANEARQRNAARLWDSRREEMRVLLLRGMTPPEMARYYKCGESPLYKQLARMGFTKAWRREIAPKPVDYEVAG
jgi:hypothetical protein